ncbi:MAG: M1 family metallopeptidase [Candidatus Saccharibacteria bacterium]|nr:M1 family metallopeptidase [Candidatus Saccharibacteria bacterium]
MERLIKYFKPEKYVLDLGIDKFQKKIGGSVQVVGDVKDEIVKFHALKFDVKQVLVNGKEAIFKNNGETLTIEKVELGKAVIDILYVGNLNENMQGAYLSTYKNGEELETIVATQFESHYAREAFPCIDEPEAKAEFDLSLTVPDAGDTVLANTQITGTKKYGQVPDGKHIVFYGDDGKKSAAKYIQYNFETTPRMSTYLLAFVIGKFKGKSVTNRNGVKITTYAALNQSDDSVDFANEIAARSLEFYDDNFGVKYPLQKLDQVALPDFEAGAMENWGLVTYRESMLLVGDGANLGTKKSVALTVAHELSHQWFGDLVTMKWWDDLWLNESFASVMEYYAVDYVFPEYKIWEGFFTGDALAALRRDCLDGVQSVHQDVDNPEEIATLFDPAIVYAKGARLMLMVIRAMGWEKFCEGVKDYFEKYQYKNTVGDELWDTLGAYAEFDVKKLMHGFIDRPGYPVICDDGSGDFTKIKQKRFLITSSSEKQKPLSSDWILPKITEDMSGHYILNLTDEEFKERLKNFDKLGLEEKLRLLIDRDLLSKTDLVSSDSLLPLVEKFKNEKSAAVWNIILTIVSGLKIFFDIDSAEEREYKKFVGELVKPGLNEIGLVTRKGDNENTLRLRQILLALDFYAENTENLKKLAKYYSDDLLSIDTEIRADVLDAKLYLEPEMYERYLQQYQENADPEIKFDLMLAMTLSKDTETLKKVMKLLNEPEIVKPQDQFHLFIYLYRNPKAKEAVFDWLTHNWEYVKKISGDKSLDNYPRYMAGSIKTEAEFKKYCDFYRPMEDEPSLKRATLMGKNEITARLELIKQDKMAVARKLHELMK